MKSKKVPQESGRLRRQEECSAQEQSVFSFQPRQRKYQDRITEFYENFQRKLDAKQAILSSLFLHGVMPVKSALCGKLNSQFAIRNSQFAIRNSQFTIHNSQFTIHNSQFTIRNSQFTIRNSQFTIHNSQFTIHNSQFTIHNSQFTIRNSQFPIFDFYDRFFSI